MKAKIKKYRFWLFFTLFILILLSLPYFFEKTIKSKSDSAARDFAFKENYNGIVDSLGEEDLVRFIIVKDTKHYMPSSSGMITLFDQISKGDSIVKEKDMLDVYLFREARVIYQSKYPESDLYYIGLSREKLKELIPR